MSIDNARGDAAARPRMLGIPEWQLEAAEAVGTNVLDDIVADSRGSWLPLSRRPSRKPQTGNAQQCRCRKGLMRHTAARCFLSTRVVFPVNESGANTSTRESPGRTGQG